MFVNNDQLSEKYHGYNPAFANRVRKKRKEAAVRIVETPKPEPKPRIRREQLDRLAKEVADAEARRKVSELLSYYREVSVERGKISIRQIILETAIKHNIKPEAITGVSRSKPVVEARHEAIWRARKERPDMSLPLIGKAFGGRDHTTVLSAIRKIERQRAALSDSTQ